MVSNKVILSVKDLFSHDPYSMTDRICQNCEADLVSVGVSDADTMKTLCLACGIGSELVARHEFANAGKVAELLEQMSATKDRQQFGAILQALKVALKCSACGEDYSRHELAKFAAYALDWAHIDRSTKLRTATGKVVHPSKLLSGGYGLTKIVEQMLQLSNITCAGCHRLQTANENA
jgi:uncharacterized protein (DUF983 family)